MACCVHLVCLVTGNGTSLGWPSQHPRKQSVPFLHLLSPNLA